LAEKARPSSGKDRREIRATFWSTGIKPGSLRHRKKGAKRREDKRHKN